ncbi:hypothetical protein [Paraburkholderia sp. 2C]
MEHDALAIGDDLISLRFASAILKRAYFMTESALPADESDDYAMAPNGSLHASRFRRAPSSSRERQNGNKVLALAYLE